MYCKRRNILYLCIFTFFAIWNLSSADISFTKYLYESSLSMFRCVPNQTAFEIENVFDPLQCGKLCYLGNTCRSVFYKPDSNKCIGCRINPQKPTCDHEPHQGSEYYTKQENNEVLPSDSDCKEIFENQCYTTSGLYKIKLWKSKRVETVFCDMNTDGGGWTVFQNRFDGSTDFYRNFDDYENGFGDLSGDFWLGLKVLQEMTSQGKTELRLDLTGVDDTTANETFRNFYVGESPSYTLHIGSGTGTKGKGLSLSAGCHFTIYVDDLAANQGFKFAVETGYGWWHKDAITMYVNLNGEYITPGTIGKGFDGMYYFKFEGWTSLKSSKMMFRRVNI